MIIGFVGTPGSGKTYEAVKKVLDNLKRGRVVCTNIDGMDNPQAQQYIKDRLNLSDSEFSERFRFLTPAQVSNFWGYLPDDGKHDLPEKICPDGSLVLIDECHKFFNSRDWQSSTNRQFSDWASTHRHAGYDLVLVTQDIEKVDKQCRSLIEWTYFFRKINFLGGAVTKKYICYSYTGDDHNGKPLAKNTRTYDPAVFPAYSSYSVADAKEIGFMTHVNILKHPVFFIIPVVLAFCIWMISKSSIASGDLFGSKKKLNTVAAVKPTAPASVPFSPPQVLPTPPPPAARVVRATPAAPSSPPVKHDIKKAAQDKPLIIASVKRQMYVYHDSQDNIVITNQIKEIPSGVPYRTETYD